MNGIPEEFLSILDNKETTKDQEDYNIFTDFKHKPVTVEICLDYN